MEPAGYFMQQTQASPGMFPGTGVQAPSLFGQIPGLEGPAGALAQMFIEPQLQVYFGGRKLPGQFAPTYNLYDQLRKRQDALALQAATSFGAQADRGVYSRFLRGMAESAGVTWDERRERAAQSLAGDLAGVTPMLAGVMGGAFDDLHGRRGSAMLFAQNMYMGGRYARDPVSGRTKLSLDSVRQMTEDVYAELYGPGADLAAMKGVGAGRAGQLYDELSRRGLLTPSLSRADQRRGAARLMQERGEAGTVDEALGKLEQMASPEVERKLRSFEASRVAGRVRSLSGAVAAMKDIFGDMGQPNAPMSQLVEGLEVLTQGGLRSMDPARVERLVRQTQVLARRTGVGFDGLTQLMGAAGQRAAEMGLDRSFGVQAAQSAAAFGQAYGQATGGVAAWGRASKEQAVLMDQQLTLNAARSATANQLAVALRAADQMGDRLDPKSELGRLAAAVRAGQTAYRDEKGVERTVYQDPGRMRDVYRKAGFDPNLAAFYARQSGENERVVAENGLADLARDLQSRLDAQPRLERAFRSGLRAALPAELRGQAAAYAGKLARAALEMDPAKANDPAALLEAAGIAVDPAQRRAVEAAVRAGTAEMTEQIKRSPNMRRYENYDRFTQLHNRQTLSERRRQVEDAQAEARLGSALAGLGQGSALSRVVDAFADNRGQKDFKDLLADVLGFTDSAEAADALEGDVFRLQQERDAFEGVSAGDVRERVAAERERLRLASERGDKAGEARSRARLQALADAFAGGRQDRLDRAEGTAGMKDADRAADRRNRLKAIEQLVPRLAGAAEARGIDTAGRVGARRTGEALEAFAGRSGDFVGVADSLLEGLLGDDRSMGLLGGEGRTDRVLALQENNRQLRLLAAREAEGDVGVLLAGEPERAEARKLVQGREAALADYRRQKAAQEALLKDRAADPEALKAAAEGVKAAHERYQQAAGAASDLGRRTGSDVDKLARLAAPSEGARAEAQRLYREQVEGLRGLDRAARGGRDELAAREHDLRQKLEEARTAGLSADERGRLGGLERRAQEAAASGRSGEAAEARAQADALRQRGAARADPAAVKALEGELGQVRSLRVREEARRKEAAEAQGMSAEDVLGQFARAFGADAKGLGVELSGERLRAARGLLPALARVQKQARAARTTVAKLLAGREERLGPDAPREALEARADRQRLRQALGGQGPADGRDLGRRLEGLGPAAPKAAPPEPAKPQKVELSGPLELRGEMKVDLAQGTGRLSASGEVTRG